MSQVNFYEKDCLPAMRKMPDNQFKLAIVDPPWGPNANYCRTNRHNGKLARLNKQYNPALWEQKPPPQSYFNHLFRVSEHQIIWGINYFLTIRKLPIGPGRIVWDKCNGGNDFSDCEIAYCSLIDSVRLFRFMWNGMMQGKSIAEGHRKLGNTALNEKRIHPTQKPRLLYRWLLSTFAEPGWNILDTHVGSGTHLLAALDLNFDIEGYEIDKGYYADAAAGVKAHVRPLDLFKPNYHQLLFL